MASIQHHDAEQGSDEWHALRCGKLTASQVRHIVTPTLNLAANDHTRTLANKLAVQRVSGEIEDTFTTDKMLRGHIDEDVARRIYSQKYAPVTEVGFITNSEFPNFGYSPDGLVGEDGLIEIKSRDPHLHFASIILCERGDGVPKEFMAQIQSGLLISGRKWCDFLSFSHGLPMLRHRVFPDPEYQEAITKSARDFEATVSDLAEEYLKAVAVSENYTPTEKIDYEGMIL